jgi:membrane protein implicated in regulation of membrane protease activity
VWRVMGSDCAAGTQVRVARTDGAVLYVEPA